MTEITIDTEKVLRMSVQNAASHAESLGMNDGQIIITPLGHIEYVYPSPGTYYQNCYIVNPEDLFNIEAIEENYNLDITGFQTDARDTVIDENNKSEGDEFTAAEEETISEYVNSYISEWKEWARHDKKDVLKVEDAEGKVIAEYTIKWE